MKTALRVESLLFIYSFIFRKSVTKASAEKLPGGGTKKRPKISGGRGQGKKIEKYQNKDRKIALLSLSLYLYNV